jgi:phosphatidylserine/phosphatidylglycerophosphate/cardiolipin synthase-like enzyme
MTQSSVLYQITVDGTTLALEGIRGYFHSRRAGLDAHLVTRLATFLDDAHDTIDCAIYDLRHPRILEALAGAVARGVQVRIAYDAGKERAGGLSADPKPDGSAAALANAGLLSHATPVHEHGRHLMHDKFVLRDGRDVWVGSANFTEGGLELQDNTCLTISSRDLVAHFVATFEALVQPQHRHTHSTAALATAEAQGVVVGSTDILPLFAPAAGESIEQELTSAIHNAQKIRLMAFLVSDPGILQALAPLAQNPQFDIRGVYDPHGMEDVLRYTSQDRALFWFMSDPRFVAAPSHAFSPGHEQDFMHNKTLVIDDQLVFTGSYNFSENAEDNDETLLKMVSEPLAAAYSHYCDVLFTTYGGVIEAPQRSRRLSGGPRVSGGPRPITNPRMPAITLPLGRVNTNPRMPAITAPRMRAVSAPLATPAAPTVPAVAPAEAFTSAPPAKPAKKSTRALDILIFVVRLKIALVVIAIIVYLALVGIVHL